MLRHDSKSDLPLVVKFTQSHQTENMMDNPFLNQIIKCFPSVRPGVRVGNGFTWPCAWWCRSGSIVNASALHDTTVKSLLHCRYESEIPPGLNNNKNNNNKMALEKLKFELEEEKAQKSFYQTRHKEVTAELQNKSNQVEEAKKKIIALENESLAKQAELKRAKNDLEEKENDIGTLGYDKDTLRNQVKEMQTQADNFKVHIR